MGTEPPDNADRDAFRRRIASVASFARAGGAGHGKGEHGKGKKSKLSGGRWVTTDDGHHIYLKGGKVVSGGKVGHTHDRHGTPIRPHDGGAADHPAHSRARFEPREFNEHFAGPGAVADHVSGIVGRKVEFRDVASMIGAPHDATVKVLSHGDGKITLSAHGPAGSYEMQRSILAGRDGKARIRNTSIAVKDQGRGKGAEIFAMQVEHASRNGVDHISTNASRSEGVIGYHVWPKFGYDGPIPDGARANLPAHLRHHEDVSGLMKTPEGRAAWKEHGESVDLKFDLRPGSQSRRVWDAYRAEKAKGGRS